MQSTTTDRFYHPELDILRFFAFLAVFMHHALPQDAGSYLRLGSLAPWVAAIVTSGGFGVDLFFVLSSYLITELLIREYRRSGRLDVRAFYIRRCLRIWPLYFTFLAFVILAVPHILPTESFPLRYQITFLTFTGNWSTALFGYPNSVVSPLWSISVEEQFYLVWPLLLAMVGVHRIGRLALGGLVIAWLTRILLVSLGAKHPAIWADSFARLDPIALGALLAVWLHGTAPTLRTIQRPGLIVLAIVSIVVAMRYLTFDGITSLLLYPLVAGACTLVLVSVLVPTWHTFSGSAVLIHMGRISYGLYIFHVFSLHIASVVVGASDGIIPLLLHVVLGFVVTVGLALTSYQFLELPFLRLKQRFSHVRSRPD